MSKSTKTLILSHEEIVQKITRMAWQIWENNTGSRPLILIGVENKGSIVADLLHAELSEISDLQVSIGSVAVDKEDPTLDNIRLSCEQVIADANVVLVDDVLNSGKTLMYSTLPILAQNPHALHTAILANRDHTRFPVKADFVGISLATTLQEHIHFIRDDSGKMEVYLT